MSTLTAPAPTRRGLARAVRHRLMGVAFIVLVLALLTASVGAYLKWFTPVAWVTVTADHTGLQLDRHADVKVRGVLVGEVRSIGSDGHGARLGLAIDRGQLSRIPADVTARLLPKTLFGQKYVDLVPSGRASGRSLAAGAVVRQDRSVAGVELEKVLDDVLPVLRAVRPDQLSVTLSALATAVQGRGERIGDTLVTLDHYLSRMNGQLPVLRSDLRKLASVLDTYDGALPDLMRVLSNVTVTSSTVADQRVQLQSLWADTTGLADTASPFLLRHEGRLIQLGQVSRPLLGVLAQYAPEYPCVMAGVVALQKNIEGTFSTGRLHITLEITRDSGKYNDGDQPVYGADPGPDCHGLPNPKVPFIPPEIDDGYQYGTPHSGGLLTNDGPTAGLGAGVGAPMGYAGTPEEQSVVDPLVAAYTGRNVSQVTDFDSLMWGSLMRGAVVNAS